MMSAAAHTAGSRNTQYKWLNWSSVRSMIVFEAFVIIVMYPKVWPSYAMDVVVFACAVDAAAAAAAAGIS